MLRFTLVSAVLTLGACTSVERNSEGSSIVTFSRSGPNIGGGKGTLFTFNPVVPSESQRVRLAKSAAARRGCQWVTLSAADRKKLARQMFAFGGGVALIGVTRCR